MARPAIHCHRPTGAAADNSIKRHAGPRLAHPRPVRGRPRRRRRPARPPLARVIDIGDCLIAHQAVRDLDIPGDDWSGATDGRGRRRRRGQHGELRGDRHRGRGPKQRKVKGKRRRRNGSGRLARPKRTLVEGRPYLAEQAAGRLWQVSADGFWQVHPAAADTLSAGRGRGPGARSRATRSSTCTAARACSPGAVAPLVGPDGAVTGVESDAAAVKNARQNLSDYPWAKFLQGGRGPGRQRGRPAAGQARHRRPAAGRPGPRGGRLPDARRAGTRPPSASPTSPATPPRSPATWPC